MARPSSPVLTLVPVPSSGRWPAFREPHRTRPLSVQLFCPRNASSGLTGNMTCFSHCPDGRLLHFPCEEEPDRHPNSSKPGRGICDWWGAGTKDADGTAGPSPARVGPHATRHGAQTNVSHPRARQAEPCRVSAVILACRVPPSPLLPFGRIQKRRI